MGTKVRVLAFAGSLRTDSFNKKLVKIAAEGARASGGEVTYLDLRDLALPIFDEDLEKVEGLHPHARTLKNLMLASDAFLVAAPEYNSSISGALKNAIDWASRPVPGEKILECFRGKIAGIMSASPGELGGLRGLVHVRAILENLGVMVIPDQIAVAKANDAFNPDGSLRDEKKQISVEQIGASVAYLAVAVKPSKVAKWERFHGELHESR